MTKFFGIEFAPLHIPFKRRLQTLAVLYELTDFMFSGFFFTILLLYLMLTPFFFIPILYFSWMFYDKDTFNRGGRLWPAFRRFFLWRYYAEYFPIKLHKTADLNPNKNYIIGYHPHGILPFGAFANFNTEATGFSEKFPGITTRPITLEM
ncbi:2-acylglycerol O-acyltransferase 2-A-like protein, partial [Dinothrombium tinctorium]